MGGFVRLLGEASPASPDDSDPDRGRRFTDRIPLRRASALVAGSAMNILTALVIFTILFPFPQNVPVETVIVRGIAPGTSFC